jgi:hypothetical protein
MITGLAASEASPAACAMLRQDDAVATLEVTAGSVTITPLDGEPQAYPVGEFALVNLGDEIAVSDDGEAYLTFFEGIESRLVAGTVAVVEQFEVDGGKAEIGLAMTVGQTITSVEAMMDAESRFEVNTPAATISVRGTEFAVFVRPNQLTQVATLDGTVEVSAQETTIELPCGYGVRVVPGEAPGTINVWGMANVTVTAPEGIETIGLPVTWVNTENQQVYHYRTGDEMMAMVVGPYAMTLNIPGPFVLPDIVFPPQTEPEDPIPFEVAVGALVLNIVESDPNITDHGDLTVRFEQGDLVGETVVAPGDPILVAPGDWTIHVTMGLVPENTLPYDITVEAGETLVLDLDANDFRHE